MTSIKRSAAVPLTIVPLLAGAIGCGGPAPSPTDSDPCLPQHYAQAICEAAVQHQGYQYGGVWYPHVYAYAPLFYHQGYSRYVASGGQVSSFSRSAYAPEVARSTVVRGGFGRIGGARGFGGG